MLIHVFFNKFQKILDLNVNQIKMDFFDIFVDKIITWALEVAIKVPILGHIHR